MKKTNNILLAITPTRHDMSGFDQVCEYMNLHKMRVPTPKMKIHIPHATDVLSSAMRYFLSREDKELTWLTEYDEVADWLANNQGRGLFLYGQCGRGKSLLCRYVLPAMLLQQYGKVTTVLDMQEVNKNIDYALSKSILSLDDVGTEEQSVNYGERRLAFAEIMDAVEKHNKLILISSNLNAEEIRRRYGERTLDRIIATTRRVLFEGKSLRR